MLKTIGGSQSDHWNNTLADQAVQALWINPDPAERDRQLSATGRGAGNRHRHGEQDPSAPRPKPVLERFRLGRAPIDWKLTIRLADGIGRMIQDFAYIRTKQNA